MTFKENFSLFLKYAFKYIYEHLFMFQVLFQTALGIIVKKMDKNPSFTEENQSTGQWYIETVSGW